MTPSPIDDVWRRACAAALVGLPNMTPSRLAILLADTPPESVWDAFGRCNRFPEALLSALGAGAAHLATRWQQAVQACDPGVVLNQYTRAGVGVWSHYGHFPGRLIGDPWAPAVLFHRGAGRCLDVPTVGIVGTRRCTQEGRENARRLGAELAEAGVAVVSGLALGIDGAAHLGALSTATGAAPVGVAGSGLEVVYPRHHHKLWAEVAKRGLLISEAPLYAHPEPWRFPARNRIIAGLSDVIVVVESNEHGGSLITVDEAQKRSVQVMAVPGSIRSRASLGTNELLRDGCAPVCCTQDILSVLSLDSSRPSASFPSPSEVDLTVLEAVDHRPISTEEIMLRVGSAPGEIAVSLLRLQEGGWIAEVEGGWQKVDDDTIRGDE